MKLPSILELVFQDVHTCKFISYFNSPFHNYILSIYLYARNYIRSSCWTTTVYWNNLWFLKWSIPFPAENCKFSIFKKKTKKQSDFCGKDATSKMRSDTEVLPNFLSYCNNISEQSGSKTTWKSQWWLIQSIMPTDFCTNVWMAL